MVIEWLAMAAMLLMLYLLCWLFREISNASNSKPKTIKKSKERRGSSIDYSQTDRERALIVELRQLVYGDGELASRLIEQVRQNNPGASFQWCVEKAIRDIHSDRSR